METDSAIDMTTATVSGDQIDVAFSRGSNEACDGAVEGQRGELPQWCNFGFGVLDKYKSNPNELGFICVDYCRMKWWRAST